MTNQEWKTWLRRGLIAGAPFLMNCGSSTGGNCGTHRVITFNEALPDAGSWDGGFSFQNCNALCSSTTETCSLLDAGLLNCDRTCVGGRAPPGLFTLSNVDASPGSWVARMAELEGAAVYAFSHLADELQAHGLKQFALYALKAANQEVQHARAITRLALGMGHCPTQRPIVATPVRTLEQVAIDNAGEGCGRELFGALINAHQAQTASSDDVRATMATIAVDERAHADFSFELARALMPKLTLAQRRRAREAQHQALERLGNDDVPAVARGVLGLMDGEQLAAASRTLLQTTRL